MSLLVKNALVSKQSFAISHGGQEVNMNASKHRPENYFSSLG
ncbi:hypothetical protein [Prochlorococcus marinus]|nr:hypothetical protein [Prochlorococcus marinus]